MDTPSFVVSAVTPEGYLRLHRVGAATYPLWDQFHEAHPVRILTTGGDVQGVAPVWIACA